MRTYSYFLGEDFPSCRKVRGAKGKGKGEECITIIQNIAVQWTKRGKFRSKQVEGTIYRIRGKNGKITLKNTMGRMRQRTGKNRIAGP